MCHWIPIHLHATREKHHQDVEPGTFEAFRPGQRPALEDHEVGLISLHEFKISRIQGLDTARTARQPRREVVRA